jgi:hypothetical protein
MTDDNAYVACMGTGMAGKGMVVVNMGFYMRFYVFKWIEN